jgi:hypothetical protein
MFKYHKGQQTESLEDIPLSKVNLVQDGDIEGPWVKQGPDYVVLQNHAVCFLPVPSWGTVLPSRNPPGERREVIDVSHLKPADGLELHPEAWDEYLDRGTIDAEGNYIPKEPEA